MKITKCIDQQHPELLLVFAGWSASAELFNDLEMPSNTDLWICSDYRTLTFAEDLSTYKSVRVVAWSLGVWVAAKLLSEKGIQPIESIAINGTACPISDQFGIPEAIFKGTLEQLIPNGMSRFNRRMCGSRECLKQYEALAPMRPLDELYTELAALYDAIQIDPDLSASFSWDLAIIGREDRIFPAENLQNYWNNRSQIRTIAAPHYPFYQWTNWNQLWKR